jgi:hypothetical protein
MKESTKDKIRKIYNISKLQKKYQGIVEQHKAGQIDDYEFIFHYNRIYAEGWRKGFRSLIEIRDEQCTRPKQEVQREAEEGKGEEKERGAKG